MKSKDLPPISIQLGPTYWSDRVVSWMWRPKLTRSAVAERKQLEEDKHKYRQRNLDLVAKEEEEEAKAKLAEGEPVPVIAGVGRDIDSKVSESSRHVASSEGARISLEGLSSRPIWAIRARNGIGVSININYGQSRYSHRSELASCCGQQQDNPDLIRRGFEPLSKVRWRNRKMSKLQINSQTDR